MKKIILTAALLSGVCAIAQQKDSAKTTAIQEVTLNKRVFSKKSDRLIYDVAASPSVKGNTAFDLLKNTPTVSTTDDKEFKVLGKSAVVIYLNGRKSNMTTEAMLALLKSTPSENISKIELITMPGSEFDVPGNTAIINILMRKKSSDGYSGTLNMKNAKGRYDNPSASATLNLRKNKTGTNLSAGYTEERYHEEVILENGNNTNRTLSEGVIDGPNKTVSFGASTDYEINDKNLLNLSLNAVFLPAGNSRHNFLNKSFENERLTSETAMQGSGTGNSKSLSAALNFDHNLDDLGSKLKINTAYLYYDKTQRTENRNFLLPSELMIYGFNQSTPQNIHNLSLQGDFIKKFKNEATFSAGLNFSGTRTDSDTFFESGNGVIFIKDEDLSNHFIYSETIGAAYANYERNLGKKISGKIGLRYEMTFTKGDIQGKPDPMYHFTKNYGNLLPFLNLNYAISDDHSLSYSFSSRISRPGFWELNPVRTYTTATNYLQNNPFMQPSKIYSQELMYMYKSAYFLTLGHSMSRDESTQIPLQKTDANGNVELRYIRTNYGDKETLSATLGMQKSFFNGRWVAGYSVTGNFTKYTGSVDTDPLTHEVFAPYIVDRKSNFIMLSTNNQIGLDKAKTWWLGVSYFLLTPQSIELGRISKFQQLNLSLKKNWQNWTFMANAEDILNLNKEFSIRNTSASGYFSNVRQRQFNRTYSLSITYNFGNSKIKKVQTAESANDAIRNRTGGK